MLGQQQAVSHTVPLQQTTAAAEAGRDEAQAQLQKAQEQMQELHGRAEGGSAALQQVKQLQERPLLTAQLPHCCKDKLDLLPACVGEQAVMAVCTICSRDQ